MGQFLAAGIHCQTGGAGAEAQGKPDPISWRIRSY
jgi:hypothetical protein